MTRTAATSFVLMMWIASLAAAVEPTDGEVLMSTGVFFDLGSTNTDSADAIVVDAAGRFVMAGSASTDASATAVVARLLPDGQLDPSYGAGGRVVDPLGWAGVGGWSEFAAVTILPDGKALLAGSGIHPSLTGGEMDMIVVRLTVAGLVDTTFAPPLGYRVVAFDLAGPGYRSDRARAIAVQVDGKIVLAGFAQDSTSYSCAIVRLTSGGALDSSFSGSGRRFFLGGENFCTAYAVGLQPGGQIVIAGQGVISGSGGVLAARLEADGDLDPTFDGDGLKLLAPDLLPGNEAALASGLVVDPAGRLILSGLLSSESGQFWWLVGALDFAGAVDTTFGTSGWVVGDFTCGSQLACSNPDAGSSSLGIARQGDGKFLIAGRSREFGVGFGPFHFGVARLLASGALDPSFVNGGQDLIDIPYGTGSGGDLVSAVALVPDGRIALAGSTEWNGLDTDFGVALLANALIFADGFEYGNRLAWSVSTP